MIRKILLIILVVLASFGSLMLTSCGKLPVAEITREVPAYMLKGAWEMLCIDGNDLPLGLYCYMEIDVSKGTFELYSNIDSQGEPRCTPGTFSLSWDEEAERTVFSGGYNYASGPFAGDYYAQIKTIDGKLTILDLCDVEYLRLIYEDVSQGDLPEREKCGFTFVKVDYVPADCIPEFKATVECAEAVVSAGVAGREVL